MGNNPLTDKKKLVEIVPVQSFAGIFNRTYRAEDGFSLEMFRGGTYLGSILSDDISSSTRSRYQRFGLRSNDTILRINLGYRTLDVKCQLSTTDSWVRPYSGVVQIAVNNPHLFALQYQQGSDPVALAARAIEDAIKRYARRTRHDDINDDTLRYEARMSLSQGVHKNYGLHVVEVLVSNISPDPKRAEMLSIKQQGMVDRTKADEEAQLQSFRSTNERGEQHTANAFNRDEDELQKQHDRRQAFLDAANKALMQKMLQDIADDVPPEIIARRYPQFAPSLGYSASTPLLPGQQPDGTLPPASAITPPSSSTSQPEYNARIGASLLYRPISDKERQAWGTTCQVAFMVYQVDSDGIAEKGYMSFGDLIIEVDDQPMQSLALLISVLNNSQPSKPLPVRVLRNGQPYDLELDMN